MLVDTIAALLCLALPPFIGASPALLPPSFPLSVRWGLAAVLLAASLSFHAEMNQAPHPFHLAYLVPFWLGWGYGVFSLAFRSGRVDST